MLLGGKRDDIKIKSRCSSRVEAELNKTNGTAKNKKIKREKVINLATEQVESCSSTGGFNILEHDVKKKKRQIKLKLMLMDEKTNRLSREEDDWH